MDDGQLDAIGRACRVQIVRMLAHADQGAAGIAASIKKFLGGDNPRIVLVRQ
jgi:hypothetical protein